MEHSIIFGHCVQHMHIALIHENINIYANINFLCAILLELYPIIYTFLLADHSIISFIFKFISNPKENIQRFFKEFKFFDCTMYRTYFPIQFSFFLSKSVLCVNITSYVGLLQISNFQE